MVNVYYLKKKNARIPKTMKKQFHSTKFSIIPTYPGVADKTYLYRIKIILLQETNESSNFFIRVYFLIFFYFILILGFQNTNFSQTALISRRINFMIR